MTNHFHFLRPYWLLALPLIAVLLWILKQRVLASNAWQKVCDAHLLPHLLTRSKKSYHLLWLLLSFAWFITILALAGPTWKRLPEPVYRTSMVRMIVLDLSPSMYAQDVSPSRLIRAKYKVQDIFLFTH